MKTLIALTLLAACSSRAPEPARTPAVAPVEQQVVVEPPAAPPAPLGDSLYGIDIPLEDADGTTIALDVGRGHPVLVSMFYGNCTTACPAIIGYMKQIAATTGDDVRILLVSFDPDRDTPARLRELTTMYGLDERWILARASAPDARTLSAVLGVKYRALASGEFAHNAVIVALDRDGQPLARVEGLGDNSQLVTALR